LIFIYTFLVPPPVEPAATATQQTVPQTTSIEQDELIPETVVRLENASSGTY
jgi:hypothetical protein